MDNPWTPKWPQKAGKYWFYGKKYSSDKPHLNYAEVWKTATGNAYVCGGTFLYPTEASGVWQEVVLPKLPPATLDKVLKL